MGVSLLILAQSTLATLRSPACSPPLVAHLPGDAGDDEKDVVVLTTGNFDAKIKAAKYALVSGRARVDRRARGWGPCVSSDLLPCLGTAAAAPERRVTLRHSFITCRWSSMLPGAATARYAALHVLLMVASCLLGCSLAACSPCFACVPASAAGLTLPPRRSVSLHSP